MLPPVNRQNCKARSGGICVFVRDFFCKYVHVNAPFTNSSHCVFWFTIDERLLLQKTLFGMVYIPPDNSISGADPGFVVKGGVSMRGIWGP